MGADNEHMRCSHHTCVVVALESRVEMWKIPGQRRDSNRGLRSEHMGWIRRVVELVAVCTQKSTN